MSTENSSSQTMDSSFVDEREDVQKKTFAKWINSQLVKNDKPLVQDLFQDLRDGEILLSLLEILTAQHYKRERGRMRVHHINNVNTALAVLEENGVKLVNISSNDIVDGNPKLILGLVWSVIVHWQVQCPLRELMSSLQHTSLEKTLLAWCRAHTRDYGVRVRDFSASWADGLAFNALLHRWRPQLFDFAAVAARPVPARLDHAFSLAHAHLGIDRLLDPEDVNTPNPDKKSIMMYVMCLFQSLPHAGEDVAGGSEPSTPVTTEPPAEPASRPLSTATTGSAELGGYYAAFEDVLAWLLEAEERLAAAEGAGGAAAGTVGEDSLARVKERFHAHERFLLELAGHQARVGAVLEEGTRLILDAGLSRDEAAEVRLQVRLLNQRWEALRSQAMATQAQVHADLMRDQHHHLDLFRQWLTATEDRMSRLGAAGGERGAALAARLAAVRALHADLRAQQPRVDALADCVIVVDDDHHADADGVTEIEDQLRALSERWAHTCQWTTQQLTRLARLHEEETRLNDEHAQLMQAIDALETELKEMEANPVSEVGAVLARVASVQRARHAAGAAGARLAAHARVAAEHAPELAERAERAQDKLDALHLILQVQAQRIKELGFELETESTSSAGDESVTTTTTTVVTVTSPASPPPPAATAAPAGGLAKKPRLHETGKDFQLGYKPFEDWADTAENILRNCERDLEKESEARAKIPASLQRVERELAAQRADFANVEEIQRRLAAEATLEEDAARHAESISNLKRRWETIERQSRDVARAAAACDECSALRSDAAAVRGELAVVRAWAERTARDKPSTNLLIHLRNKLRQLKRLEPAKDEINAKVIVLRESAAPRAKLDELQSESQLASAEYDAAHRALAAREAELKLALNKKPSLQHEQAWRGLAARVAELSDRALAEHALLGTNTDDALTALAGLAAEHAALEAACGAAVAERRELFDKGSAPDLRSSLENLATKFDDTRTILHNKIDKLEKGLSQLQQVQAESREVSAWLDAVDAFLKENELVPLGEPELLDRLLHDSNKYDEEISKYEEKVSRIESIKEAILEDCESALAKSLHSDVSALKTRRLNAARAIREHNEQVRRAGEKTSAVFRAIDEVEFWLQEVESQIPPEEECAITDSAALYRMKTHFQTLKEKCDDKTPEFRNLNETSNDMLLAAEARRPAALARRVTHINARWSSVMHGVYERYKVLGEAWHESGELRAWLAQEAAWLEGLARRLRRSPDAPADAEEIAHELSALESCLANRAEDRLTRIQTIGAALQHAHIMPNWINAEVTAVTDRWERLRAQAQQRMRLLERAASAAQRSELELDTLQQWLERAARVLAAPRAQLASADIQRVRSELPAQRGVMGEVEAQAEAYARAGKHEAAARLRDQLQLLQSKFSSLEERLQAAEAAGSPAPAPAPAPAEGDIGARVSGALAALAAVQRGAGAGLVPADPEPDAVRAQLRTCLKYYRTLSEIKSEVESIIKSGRRAVEAGAGGAELSARIDALKELYNKLGAGVTESKARLEAALLAARDLQAGLLQLQSALDRLPALGAGARELEMSRMEATRASLRAHLDVFSGGDPARLQPLRDKLDELDARWAALRRPAAASAASPATPARARLAAAVAELDGGPLPAARLRALHDELRAAADDPELKQEPALALLLQQTLERLAPAYETLTDTIKRRLEAPPSPSPTPGAGPGSPPAPAEAKRSRIPLALRSPLPIRRELTERRAPSLERAPSVASTMSSDSVERSVPGTPDTPRHDSSTFNLLHDSDLFTQISENKITAAPAPAPAPAPARPQPCHVVSVTAHEIVKSNVTEGEAETATELAPQRAETVRVVDDTERESSSDSAGSDSSDGTYDTEERPGLDLGTEPRTFVVEVRTLEQRMRPTRGVVTRRAGAGPPDLIPKGERREDANEYLILDEVPGETAALPEPSHTADSDRPKTPEETAAETDGSLTAEEVIYSEVEDAPQARMSGGRADASTPTPPPTPVTPTPTPLHTSTPLKERAHVVAMSPKLRAPPEPLQGNYQKTDDDGQQTPPSPGSPRSPGAASPGGPAAALVARWGAAAGAEVATFSAAAGAMSRRLDVTLLTVGGVTAERDPAKRLEILKSQVGSVAPDAAALISRGDSLVYAAHARDPLLADYIQTHALDKLRNKWSLVMSEVEAKRALAAAAEDQLAELGSLLRALEDWLRDVDAKIDTKQVNKLKEELVSRESDVERIQELCRALRAQHVGWPERALAAALQGFARAKDAYEKTHGKHDKKQDGAAARCGEFVLRANRAREAVARLAAALKAAPLGGKDYDDFPLQEDALARIRSSIPEVQAAVEAVEKQFGGVKASAGELGEQVTRVRDKLRDEWRAFDDLYRTRCDKHTACQGVWAALYAALEAGGEWADGAARALAAAERAPLDDRPRILDDVEKQMAPRLRTIQAARAHTRTVVCACGAALARDVQEQMDQLNERAHLIQLDLKRLRALPPPAAPAAPPTAPLATRAATALAAVKELLEHTTPNPSDATSLAIRASLVKAREEELSGMLREARAERARDALPDQLQKAQAALSAHRALLAGKLSALQKYCARLEAARGWAGEARARADKLDELPADRRSDALSDIQACVSERDAEIREVLENYNNLERECSAARQSVAPDLKDKVMRLKDDWAAIRACADDRAANDSDRTANVTRPASSEVERAANVSEAAPLAGERTASASPDAARESARDVSRDSVRSVETPVRAGAELSSAQSSESGSRKSSVDSQHSEWSVRASGRRRSSQQSPAAVLAHFDTSVHQIRDWLSLEAGMLRAPAVAVGDVDDITHQIDKQKGVLRELEQKKPQLDELLHTAESLKGTENRQQLHGKGTS